MTDLDELKRLLGLARDAALARVKEMEGMFLNGVPSYRAALTQRDAALAEAARYRAVLVEVDAWCTANGWLHGSAIVKAALAPPSAPSSPPADNGPPVGRAPASQPSAGGDSTGGGVCNRSNCWPGRSRRTYDRPEMFLSLDHHGAP